MKEKILKAFMSIASVLFALGSLAQPSTTALWGKTWNNAVNATNPDYGRAVYTDGSNVWTVGNGNYSASFNGETVIIKYDMAGTVVWTRTVNPSSNTGGCWMEGGYSIAIDGNNNVCVAASVIGTTNDMFALIKLTSAGAMVSGYPKYYSTANCGVNGAAGYCIATSGTDVYIGGSYYNGTNYQMVVAKDNTSGSGWAWTPYTYTGSGNTEARCTDIKVNANGVFATGWVTGTNGRDVVTLGINSSTGAPLTGWPQTYNNALNSHDEGNAIGLDASGNVYVAGYATVSLHGKDGLLLKYSSGGTLQTGFPVLYDLARYDDSWSDIEVIGTSSTAPALYVGGYSTNNLQNCNYAIAAYTSTGSYANGTGNWTTDPVYYDGNKTGTEASGTDRGYGIAYSSTTGRVYITGMSDEGTSLNNVNLTTKGYNATTGALVWNGVSYDLNSDNPPTTDETYWKYAIAVTYSGCFSEDQICVTGASVVSGQGFNMLTVKYGSSGTCSSGPAARFAQPANSSLTTYGLYPNPFSNRAELRLDPNTQLVSATLDVFDVSGRKVASIKNIGSATILIERGDLNKGLYFFKLSENDQLITSGKFVIEE